jgi:hypothetical protein
VPVGPASRQTVAAEPWKKTAYRFTAYRFTAYRFAASFILAQRLGSAKGPSVSQAVGCAGMADVR